MINVSYNKGEIRATIDTLREFPREARKALSRALNRTATTVRKEMSLLVRQKYDIKAREVNSELNIEKAFWNKLYSRIHGSGSPGLPLKYFAKTKKVPSTRRLKSGAYRPSVGIPVRILKGRGKIPAKGVFLAEMDSGHVGAFRRDGTSRLGISKRYGPSPLKILASKKYDAKIKKVADEELQKNVEHEVGYQLRRLGFK